MENNLEKDKMIKKSALISKDFVKKPSKNSNELKNLYDDLEMRKNNFEIQSQEMRKKSDEINKSNEKYYNFYDFAPSGHFTIDEDGKIIEANLAFHEILCEGKNNLIGKKFNVFLDNAFKELFVDHLKKVKQTGQNKKCELELIKKNRNKLTVKLKTNPICDINGKLVFRNAIQDISKLTKAKEDIRFCDYYNRCLIENNLDSIFNIDFNGDIKDVNHATEIFTGYSRKKLLGTNFSKYFTDEKKALDVFQLTLEKEKIKNFSMEIKNRKGYSTPVLFNGSIIKDKFDEISGILVVARDISEQISSNEKIKQLASIVESSNDAIISKSLDGTINSWNKGAERIFGYSKDEILGKDVNILKSPDMQQKTDRIIERLKKGKTIDNFETIRFRKDGTKIYVSITCSPIFDNSGEIIGTSTITRDISPRKKAEKRLKEYQKNLEKIVKKRTKEVEFQAHLLEQVSDAIIVYDDKNRIKYWNKGAEVLYNIKSENAIGKNRDYIYSNEWFSLEDEKSAHLHLKKRGYWQGENIHIKSDGDQIYVESAINKIKMDKGKKYGYVAVIRDVTVRKEIEDELKKSEEKYRLIVEKNRSGVFLIDSFHNLSYVNPRMAEMLDYSVKELIGRKIFDFVDAEGQDKLLKHFNKHEEGLGQIYEVKFLNKRNEELWVLISTNPLFDIKGDYLGSVSVMIDIHARKGVEKVMIEEMKEKDQDLVIYNE
ncbi:MAG: PAS domain S-box protein [Methanomicrobiales archaeon]